MTADIALVLAIAGLLVSWAWLYWRIASRFDELRQRIENLEDWLDLAKAKVPKEEKR